MNPRSPVVTLTADEGTKLRAAIRRNGVSAVCRALGPMDSETLYKAAAEVPVHRMIAGLIRGSLDRI